MVLCCNPDCEGSWFHFACVHVTEAPGGDWYCSKQCEDALGYIYCTCHKKRGAEDANKVQCALKDKCKRREFYHPSCVSLDDNDRQGICFVFLIVVFCLVSMQ